MTRVIMWLLCTGIVLSPIVQIGVYLRYDQLFFLSLTVVVLLRILVKGRISVAVYNTLKPWVLFLVSYSIIDLTSSFLGSLNLYNILNFPLKIMLSVLTAGIIISIGSKEDNKPQLFNEQMFLLAGVVAVIGILQYLEHIGIIPFSVIRGITSELFPYHGILSDAELRKTSGYYLKMGGAGRVTGTFDGQPILFGDFLATVLVVSLHKVQRIGTAIIWLAILLALILTQSRGSWLGAIVGIGWYLIVLLKLSLGQKIKISPTPQTKKLGGRIMIGLLLIFLIIYISPIGAVITNRLGSTLNTLAGTGLEEKRFSDRWPNAIRYLLDKGPFAVLFGSAGLYDAATDSMYLWLLVNVGLLGILIFLALHIVLFRRLSRSNENNNLWSIGWQAAIVGLMVTYIFHPTWQGDRLLTYFIVGTTLTMANIIKTKHLFRQTTIND